MPYGISWSVYLKQVLSTFVAMAIGSQIVHTIYRPLKGMRNLVEEEKEKIRQERAEAAAVAAREHDTEEVKTEDQTTAKAAAK